MMRLFRNRKGFTLIELMIVIAIIAILAAILVPNFIQARAQSQWTACISNLKNMGTALEMYSTDSVGHYPAAIATLVPTWIANIPTCPANATAYVYAVTQTPDAFTVNCDGTGHTRISGLTAGHPLYSSQNGSINK